MKPLAVPRVQFLARDQYRELEDSVCQIVGGVTAALLVNLFLPFNRLLVSNLELRYVLGCAVLFSPILMANLIFGRLFGATDIPDIAFASNLLGAFIDGTLEYASLQFGYHLLLVPVLAAYGVSFLAVARRQGWSGLVRGQASLEPIVGTPAAQEAAAGRRR